MTVITYFRYFFLLLLVVFVTACGGGSSGDEEDTTPPEVLSTSPINDATGVSLDAVITAKFSEALDSTTVISGNFTFVDKDNKTVSGTLGYDPATRTASFTPDENLKENTTYTLTISAVIADAAGNSLEDEYSWSFTTRGIPPTVTGASPEHNSTGIVLSSLITVTFSEAMDLATITNTNFTLEDTANNAVSGTVNYNAGTKTATFTASGELVENTRYTATITTGVKDLAGNALKEVYAWTFTTTNVATDTDGDGLIDRLEKTLYRTSPVLADTDGDGLSDFDEVAGGGNNPLVANVPRLEVDFVGDVTVDILVEQGCTVATDSLSATMNQAETSFTRNAATSTETTISKSQEISSEISANYPWSFSAKVSASYSASQSTTRANSSSWEGTSAKTAQQQYQQANAEECFSNTNPDAGKVTMGFKITNTGTLAFSLDSLLLTASYRDPLNPLSLKTLTSVDPITETGSSTTLAAGTSTGTMAVTANVPTQRARDLLFNPAGLFFEVGTYNMTEEGGRNIAWINDVTSERTAVVTVDYGSARQDIANRNVVDTYLVATNVERNPDGSSAGVSMARVMEVLGIPYTTEVNQTAGKTILASVDGIKYDESKRQVWMISGNSDDLDSDKPFDDIRIYPREFITLTLLRDSDYDPQLGDQNDLLFDREEYAFGTDPFNHDTDSDGLNDGYEIKTGWTDLFSGEKVNSSPLVADSEGDGFSDAQEAAAGTNPWKADTDVDSLPDATDNDPVVPVVPPDKVLKVVAGETHTMAIMNNGSLWLWGSNDKGQLGVGDFDDHLTPTQEPTLATDWIDVAGGASHTLAIKANGTLWAAGWNNTYQLGRDVQMQCPPNSTVTYCSNQFVQVDTAFDWVAVAAGSNHNLALKANGTLWAWGANGSGQLGLGDTTLRQIPTRIGTDSDWGSITAGWYHSLAAKTQAASCSECIYLWGSRTNGESLLSNPIGTPYQAGVAPMLAAGQYFSLALKREDDPLYPAQLFLAGFESFFTNWVYGANNIKAVAAGGSHFLFIKLDGSLYAWGSDYNEQLGLGPGDNTYQGFIWEPQPSASPLGMLVNVPATSDEQWMQVSAGEKHSAGIKADGSLWVWGDNSRGQLGDGSTSTKSTPTRITVQ